MSRILFFLSFPLLFFLFQIYCNQDNKFYYFVNGFCCLVAAYFSTSYFYFSFESLQYLAWIFVFLFFTGCCLKWRYCTWFIRPMKFWWDHDHTSHFDDRIYFISTSIVFVYYFRFQWSTCFFMCFDFVLFKDFRSVIILSHRWDIAKEWKPFLGINKHVKHILYIQSSQLIRLRVLYDLHKQRAKPYRKWFLLLWTTWIWNCLLTNSTDRFNEFCQDSREYCLGFCHFFLLKMLWTNWFWNAPRVYGVDKLKVSKLIDRINAAWFYSLNFCVSTPF